MVGRVDGNACMTSSTDRDGACTQAAYSALPSGDVRRRSRAASARFGGEGRQRLQRLAVRRREHVGVQRQGAAQRDGTCGRRGPR